MRGESYVLEIDEERISQFAPEVQEAIIRLIRQQQERKEAATYKPPRDIVVKRTTAEDLLKLQKAQYSQGSSMTRVGLDLLPADSNVPWRPKQ